MHCVFLLGEAGGFVFETSGLQEQPLKSVQIGRFAAIWTEINSFEMVGWWVMFHQSGCSIVTAQSVKICSSNLLNRKSFFFCIAALDQK